MLGAIVAIVRSPEFVLTKMVDLWSVSDEVTQADAVAVFGGGLETRPFAAARFYHDGLAQKTLVSNVPLDPVTATILYSETDANRKVLIHQGVPDSAIELFGEGLTNTYQEATALREWALANNAHTIIVPTEYFSSRRVHWILSRVFTGTDVRIEVPALDPPQYRRSAWWRDENAIVDFQNEVLKYVYYRLKYGYDG